MSESVTLKSYFYEVLIPSSQKNTSSPIEDILHHVSKYIFYEKACALQMFQSTHPHGVRPSLYVQNVLFTRGFNPRTHTGCDMTPRGRVGGEIKFQSTHPHGVRLPSLLIATPYPAVSIHAPTRGATDTATITDTTRTGFNPRTHTGCDNTLY